MNKFIPLSVPNMNGNEIKYVTDAIKSSWVSTAGEYVTEFETKLANYVGAKSATSCQNGTAAMHISLIVCDVTKNDEVIVPALTFIATINPIKYIGATPIFMDCDDSLTIDINKLKSFCKQQIYKNNKLINRTTLKHIKAIIVVHVFGNMANMEQINIIAKKYNLKVIEDAAEALGTHHNNKYAGTIGDIGIYSFNGNKIITTGGGGMIVSQNLSYIEKAKFLTTQAKSDDVYFVHDQIGYNYRLTNLQAALGIAQLEQIENFIQIKKRNYFIYKNAIQNIKGLKLLDFDKNISPNYWFYSLYIDDNFAYNRDRLIKYLAQKNIQVRPIWKLNNEQKPYKDCMAYKITNAKKYIKHVINLPCSSNITDKEIFYVIKCLRESSL